MLACVLEPVFRAVVPLYLYTAWYFLVSPLDSPTIYTLMDPEHWSSSQPLQISKRIPLTYMLLFFSFSPSQLIGSSIYLVPQHQTDGKFGGVGVVLKYLFDFFSLSYPTFNSTVGSALLEYYRCLQAFNFSPSLILLLAILQIYQIWCCLRAFALT